MIEEKQILIIVDHLDSVIEGGGARTSIFNFLLFFSAHLNLTYLSVEYLNNFSATHSKPSGLECVRANYPNSFTELIKKLSTFCIRNKESVIYLNSFYSKTGTFIPLLLVRFLGIFVKTPKMVLAPRGGVSKGALSVKKYRKIIYLKTLLYLGFFKNVRFHAVTKIEKEDICRILGESYISQCFEAANLVNAPKRFEFSKKLSPSGRLRIVFLARLHKIKNLSFLSEALNHVKTNVSLDIYGIIEDQEYFDRTMALFIEKNKNVKITYIGAPNQEDVPKILSRYELYVLPTLGENFGHTIYESLNAGTPVLVSDRTPWKKTNNLAIQVESLDKPIRWGRCIDKISILKYENKLLLKKASALQAKKWFKNQKFTSDYEALFGTKMNSQ